MPTKPPAKTPGTKQPATLKSVVSDSRLLPMLNYGLLFLMVVSIGISGIIALLIANFAEEGAADWLKSHYEFQKRTFWIGIAPVLLMYLVMIRLHVTQQTLLLALVAIPLLFIGGRAVVGFNHLFYNRPYPNPKAWLI